MGTLEIMNHTIRVCSHIITYGNAANTGITEQICNEIAAMWNEPRGTVQFAGKTYPVHFHITAAFQPGIAAEEIFTNTDPVNNYFRIEETVRGEISFVDGLGCNTGYFKLENLYKGSTTAAHEYGHTLGLAHPADLDFRGKGTPGIMYPRGTLVDPQYQYEPEKPAGEKGGTLFPIYRKVRQEDIELLGLDKILAAPDFYHAVVGDFSSIWHPDHRELA